MTWKSLLYEPYALFLEVTNFEFLQYLLMLKLRIFSSPVRDYNSKFESIHIEFKEFDAHTAVTHAEKYLCNFNAR